jgi:hypothetical protein
MPKSGTYHERLVGHPVADEFDGPEAADAADVADRLVLLGDRGW